jgi:hypothetical protein
MIGLRRAAGIALTTALIAAGCVQPEVHSTLVASVPESPGSNCARGGHVLLIGSDLDDDGELGSDEVKRSVYVCNGEGQVALIKISEELPGGHCSEGGFHVVSGLDADGDGALGAAEARSSEYVCDGQPGASGIIVMTPEPAGARCAAGGVYVRSGQDSNRDGSLQASEVTSDAYVCNGRDGHSSLIRQTVIPIGSPSCIGGGVLVESGIDQDDDGVLEDSEVTAANQVCQIDLRQRKIFVTSTLHTGNLGGAAGADAACTRLAQAAGLEGRFVAWLSSSTASAISRVLCEDCIWTLVGSNARVFEGKVAITAYGPRVPIDRNELGELVPSYLAWTGTGPNGQLHGGTSISTTCSDWSQEAANDYGVAGGHPTSSYSGNLASDWTIAWGGPCHFAHRLICLEL